MNFRVLDAFKSLFDGQFYNHRKSTLGDYVAASLYDELYELRRSPKLINGITTRSLAINTGNKVVGKAARRGDGTFGDAIPGVTPIMVAGSIVARSRIASVEIGVETKILAKAMIKQIDRVNSDLRRQSAEFREHSPHAITVAIVGINHAESYFSVEGSREFPTDGRLYKHPIQEAGAAEQRLIDNAVASFDEFIFLRFRASNIDPFPFEWVNEDETRVQYAASLARVSREYEKRF